MKLFFALLSSAVVFAVGCGGDGSAGADGGMSADVSQEAGTPTPPSGSGIRGLFPTWTGFGALGGDGRAYFWNGRQRSAMGRVLDSGRAIEIAAAQSGSVWRTAEGAVRGPRIDGELSEPAVHTRLPSGVAQVVAGSTSFVARMASGEINLWSINRRPSTPYPGVSGAVFATYGRRRNNGEFVAVVRSDGSVVRIEGGGNGMVAPAPVAGLAGVAKLSAGTDFECVLSATGAVRCFGGTNSTGQLGDGSTTPRPDPSGAPEILQGVAELASGLVHTCARMTNGTVQCWGSNVVGQLGRTASNMPVTAPVAVPDITGVTAIAANGYTTCVLKDDASVWCWGSGSLPAPTRMTFSPQS